MVVPSVLQELVSVTLGPQAEPRTILGSIEVARRADPGPACCAAANCEDTVLRLLFFEATDRFLSCRM